MDSLRQLFDGYLNLEPDEVVFDEAPSVVEETVNQVNSSCSCLISQPDDWTTVGYGAVYVAFGSAVLCGLNKCLMTYRARQLATGRQLTKVLAEEDDDDMIEDPDWRRNETDTLAGTVQELLAIGKKLPARSAKTKSASESRVQVTAKPDKSVATADQVTQTGKKKGRPGKRSASASPESEESDESDVSEPQPKKSDVKRGRPTKK